MTVRLIPPADPRKLSELVLWTLTKPGQYAEARVRMTPIGPELRFFVWRAEKKRDEADLLWSRIFRPEDGAGVALGDWAEMKRREFLVRGWEIINADTSDDRVVD